MATKKNLRLHNGMFAVVDAEDFCWLNQWQWRYSSLGYAYRLAYERGEHFKQAKTIYMHRQIMNTAEGLDTDHINHDKLDNRKSNLRIATRTENNWNRNPGLLVGKSGYRGVYKNSAGTRWHAKIKVNGRYVSLGGAATAEEAFALYQEAWKKYRQGFCLL